MTRLIQTTCSQGFRFPLVPIEIQLKANRLLFTHASLDDIFDLLTGTCWYDLNDTIPSSTTRRRSIPRLGVHTRPALTVRRTQARWNADPLGGPDVDQIHIAKHSWAQHQLAECSSCFLLAMLVIRCAHPVGLR